MNKTEKILKDHIERIVKLTDDEFTFLKNHFTLRSYKKKETIFEANSPVENLYFIISGLVKLIYIDGDAKQHIVSFAMEDWWETDFYAYYSKHHTAFSLECIENTEVYCLSLQNFNTICKELQKMEHFFLKKSIAGHISSQNRILSFLTSSAQQRFEQLRIKNPALLQRLPKTTLAPYLGVSRETLSRFFRHSKK